MSLTKTIGDKLFLVMSNLYFLKLSRGIQADFNESFPDGQVLDFADVFPVRAASTRSGVYLAQEPGLEMWVPLVFLFFLLQILGLFKP